MVSQALHYQVFDVAQLKSIHGSSFGSIIAILLVLKIPIQEFIEYVITRKWNKWLKLNMEQFITHKGCISIDRIKDAIIPFFNAYDISPSITMKELYEFNPIDLHIYTTLVTHFTPVDLHHTTHPDVMVIDAICMSTSIPILFTPIKYKEEYYIDGGVMTHCPIISESPETILYILIDYKPIFNLESPIEFVQHILAKCIDIIIKNTNLPSGNIFRCNTDCCIDPLLWMNCLTDETYRKKMVDIGMEHVNQQIDLYKNNINVVE
jgi:hypothetical protein